MDNTVKFPKTGVLFCSILNQDSQQLQSLLATFQFGIFISKPHMVPKYKININYVFLCLFIMYCSLLWDLGCVCLFYHNQSINHFHLCRSLLLAPMVFGFCAGCLVWGIFLLFQVVCFGLFNIFFFNIDFSWVLIFLGF